MFAGDKNAKVTDEHQYVRTYCSPGDDEGKALVNEIATAIAAAMRERTRNEPSITDVDIVLTPVVSSLFGVFKSSK